MHIRADRFAEAEAGAGQGAGRFPAAAICRSASGWKTCKCGITAASCKSAERRYEQEKTAEAAELVKKMKAELNRLELDIYRRRSDLNPSNLALKFELGIRLKRAGKFQEAVQCLQLARADGKRKAQVHLELGECFQRLKNYLLAMRNFERRWKRSPIAIRT